MYLARVVGSVWATVKHPPTEGGRFLMIQPIDDHKKNAGDAIAALDTVGAGVGEVVMYITSYEAVLPWLDRHPHLDVVGVDAAVIGIVDRIDSGEAS